MSQKIPLQLVGEAYADETLPYAAQESINCYPVLAETSGTRNVAALKGTPGIKAFGNVGTGTIRGNIVMAGVAYFVADTQLYSVDAAGVGTALGTIEGSGRVGIAENGYQLVVVNGPKGWVYNKDTAVFAQITDPDFPGAIDCCFIGQYIALVAPESDQWFISDLANATAYDALDFQSAETATDLANGILPLNREAWVFGETSIEAYTNTGAADFPFERTAVIDKGLAATHAKAALDNTIYWLASNGIVYKLQGYSAVRVSKRPIEQALARETLSEAFAFAYEDSGGAFFVLTFPNGKTWVYDVSAGMWHRRKSHEMARWRPNSYLFAYGKHLVGDTSQGLLGELDRNTFTEYGNPLVWERKTQYVHADGNYIRGAELELHFDTGNGLTTGQGSDPQVEMAYSDDGGRNFTNFRQASLGKTGEYGRRVRFQGLGRFLQRMFWIRISDPVKRDLIAASGRGG